MLEMMFEDSLHPQVKTNGLYTVDRNNVIVISQMLANFLSTDRVRVVFSNSANNLENCILNGPKFDKLIVYYDLVYDNPKTVIKLTELLEVLCAEEMTNVAVVPIHCIEWHCIKCFGKESELKRIVLNCEDYTGTQVFKYNMSKKNPSNEKFCKAAFGELLDKKFHGYCEKNEYSITGSEEKQLAYSLPLLFTRNTDCVNVVARDVLKVRYAQFVKKLKCEEAHLKSFENVVDRYLGLLEL